MTDVLKQRWESRQPIARMGFFGARGYEECGVYAVQATGQNLLAVNVDRHNGYLTQVVVHASHLVFFVDRNPRQASGQPPNARVFFDGGQVLDLAMDTVSGVTFLRDVVSCFVYERGQRMRALVGLNSVSEIHSLVPGDDELLLLTCSNFVDDELWPDIGHKR